MDAISRRKFLASSAAATAIGAAGPSRAQGGARTRSARAGRTRFGAYYLRAQMYTCVPAQIRQDMEWMADKGTDFICVAILEQDIFAATENIALIIEEAGRVGMKILAVPSRWGGLVSGAPKVPSLFSVLNPDTWIKDEHGRTAINSKTSGVISSVHSAKTLAFFQEKLSEIYRQHPDIAGFILDEPKAFIVDRSDAAIAALGADAPAIAHYRAARDFYTQVCRFAKQQWPTKSTLLFQQAFFSPAILEMGADIGSLDYYGIDGRPWTRAEDLLLKNSGADEDGIGKILLDGPGAAAIERAAAKPGRKSLLLIENQHLCSGTIDLMDRYYAQVLGLGADLYIYSYYPRSVDQPERAMAVIGKHLKAFAR